MKKPKSDLRVTLLSSQHEHQKNFNFKGSSDDQDDVKKTKSYGNNDNNTNNNDNNNNIKTENENSSAGGDSNNPMTPVLTPLSTPNQKGKHNLDANDPLKEYDYCMVLPTRENNPNDVDDIGRVYLDHFSLVGINWILISSLNLKHIYVLFKAKMNVLRQLAMDLEYQLLLDPVMLQKVAEAGSNGISPLKIQHVPEESPLLPYHHIYAPYRKDDEVDQNLYWRPSTANSPFRDLVRMKLTHLLVETKLLVPTLHTGLGAPSLSPSPASPSSPQSVSNLDGSISIRRALLNEHIIAFFPLHHNQSRERLAKLWLIPWLMPWYYPTDDIKEYFGEKIALYFDFMGHYTLWLLIPALVGLPIQLICWSENDYNTPGQVAFSCLLVMWAVCMLEYWKRKEKSVALKRGMLDYEDNEVDRPEFGGVSQPSYVDGKMKIYFPKQEKRRRLLIAGLVTLGCIGIVVGAVISIYIMRAALQNEIGSVAQILSSVVNAIQIQFFKYWYVSLADTLTEWENPRTDTEFEDAMIPKLYMFEFVNSYASFFYVAFIAPSLNDCASETCMAELGANLIIIFAIRVASGMITEGLYPFYLLELRNNQLRPLLNSRLTEIPPIDLQFNMAHYDIIKDSLSEYSEIAIQFGYIVLFASALPIASLVGFICSVLETKVDAYKFLYLYKKPTIQGAQDIGTWQLIFTVTTVAAVVTNAALIVFTMNYLDKHSLQFRFWFFCIFQWVIFGLLVILMEAIPDIPTEISIQLQRQRILVEKVIFRIKDLDQNNTSTDSNELTSATSEHLQIYDYVTFLQQIKSFPFKTKKQFSNISQKMFQKLSSFSDEDRTPNQSPMPTVYSLPTARRGKYSYSRSGSNALPGGSNRVLDDSMNNEEGEGDVENGGNEKND